MILKYVFIKKYLKIKNLEVNLDNRYEFNINNDILTLEDSSNSIPDDFYSKNLNLSCLIGKNGSGKTCVMSFLTSIGAGEALRINYDADYIAVFLHKDKYYVLDVNSGELSFKSGSMTVGNLKIPLENDDITLLNNYNSYYLSSNNTNMIKSGIISIENDFSVGNEKRYKGMHNLIEILHFIKTYPFDEQLNKLCKDKIIRLVISDQWLGMLNLGYFFNGAERSKNITSRIKNLKRNDPNGKFFLALIIILRISSVGMNKKSDYEVDNLRRNLKRNLNIDLINDALYLNNDEKIYASLNEYIYDKSMYNMCLRIGELIEFNDIRNETHVDFSLEFKDLDILNKILNLSIDNQILAEGYKYYIFPPFSTGQWKRIELACKINSLDHVHGSVINLFIDEPDADLHPEMQTKLISWLINLIKEKEQIFNIVISTHNPIILSDFPRKKVIYIDGEGLESSKHKTLAANVYNLYKDSFLVSNAISEFVRNKIDITLENENVSDLLVLISEISEPLIVRSLSSKLKEFSSVSHKPLHDLSILLDRLSDEEKDFLRSKLNEQ